MSNKLTYFTINSVNISILLFAFLIWGEFSVFFVGALLFMINGFLFPYFNRTYNAKLFDVVKTAVIFFVIIWVYFVLKIPDSAELIRLTGFLWYFIDFAAFFALGYFLTKIKRNEVKMLVFYALTGILIYRVCVFFSHPVAGSVMGMFYFFAGVKIFLKRKIKWYFVIAGLTLPYLFLYLFTGNLKELTLANTVWIIISILFSWAFVKSKVSGVSFNLRQMTIVISYVLIAAAFYIGFLNLTEYLFNRNTHLPQNKFFIESFTDMEGVEVSSDVFKGKMVVLDLWTTNCSRCFEKFPEFEKFYDENKDKVLIYAVGLPHKNQSRQKVEQLIQKLDYHFPYLISNNNFTHYREEYNIAGVPAIIILDKNGKVVYNSSLNNKSLIWVNNLQRIVHSLLLKNDQNNNN